MLLCAFIVYIIIVVHCYHQEGLTEDVMDFWAR